MAKYLAIYTESVFIPGDERSRTNPGHGYPERTEHYPVLKWFRDDKELIDWADTWGEDKELLIYELAGKVTLEKKTTVSLSRG